MADENDTVRDRGDIGAEGEKDADNLPAAPNDDDTPLGDTDQHSQVPSPPAQTGR